MTRAITTRAVAFAVNRRRRRSGSQPRGKYLQRSCTLSGTVAFQPPLTNTPQSVTQFARATGTCSGTFIGGNGQTHQLNSAPVSYRATEYASGASCNAGTDSGSGTIIFPDGTIKFTISETRVSGGVAVTLKGAAGGSAVGQANISPAQIRLRSWKRAPARDSPKRRSTPTRPRRRSLADAGSPSGAPRTPPLRVN